MEIFENEIKPQHALLVSVDTGEYDAQASLNELVRACAERGRRNSYERNAEKR